MDDQLTAGQYRVGVSFNPSGFPIVGEVKEDTAKLIDLALREVQASDNPEKRRALAEAATLYEAACMWLVKGLTR
jgi:hypothetical protein